MKNLTLTVAATMALTGAAAEAHFDGLASEIEQVQKDGYGQLFDDIDLVTVAPVAAGGYFGNFQGTDLDGRWG